MKRAFAVFACIIVAVCCLFATSCKGGQSVFVFLSVRMKGNGDGTVTAVAQNEFELGGHELPVTLTLYYSEEFTANIEQMTELESVCSEDLNFGKKLTLCAEVKAESCYCARIAYVVNGETKYIQSDTVRYGTDGNRLK